MSHRFRSSIILIAGLALVAVTAPADAQVGLPDHYRVADEAFGELPGGRSYGAVSALYPAPDGQSIWVAERCGANTCKGSDVDPILQFDLDGNLLRSFGAGMFVWPHGMHVDRQGNVWVADAVGYGVDPEGKGHVVMKFSPEGELLMTLGTLGVEGDGPDTFRKPADVVVAPDGSIFVADGHDSGPEANNRIVKFSPEGRFIKEFGSFGSGPGELNEPHGLAMDAQGRLFVADRYNNRIQIFDQEGNHLLSWTQFSRPSGLFIRDDALYAADSESNTRRNPGWPRGIYIGSARTGRVHSLIRDPEPDPDNSGTSGAEGVAVDQLGNVYGGEVGPRSVRKYVKEQERGEFSFFITSQGPGDGANMGGLAGADSHCDQLAYNVGAGDLTWQAYLSAVPEGGQPGVNARDRIGEGPWYNADGALAARSVEELHADNNLRKQVSLNERGQAVNGRGDSPNRHDILTGSTMDGRFLESGDDTTCSNWTSNASTGSALVGHHDRTGGGANPSSWNSAHASRGCGQENLQATGGDGLFYCFAVDPRR